MKKIAINGFGRIGRHVLRIIFDKHPDLRVVAVNDLADTKTLAHLLKHDSVYGTYGKKIEAKDNSLTVDGKEIKITAEKDPANLPWKELGVDIVLECTGNFTEIEEAGKHISAGAKKVIISAPSKSKEIRSFVLGVNEEKYDSDKDHVISMASCTTNCLAPVAKVLNDNFKIIKGFMTTIHAYTNDQRILDVAHKDLRRARAAALNIIPTSTGAAKALGQVIPELDGKLDGIALRVPTPTVSIVDLICQVEKNTTIEEVNKTLKKASETKEMKEILWVEESPLVSSDFVGNSYSSIVDASLTMVKENMVKIFSWYDNEYGYAFRLADFSEYIGKKL
jgi:glyceraldehyde 3-phosphate dehydrogenase